MTPIQPLIDYAVEHPEQTAGLLAGVGATAAHYAKTGKIPLGRLPWRHARSLFHELRDQWYGRPRPKGVPAIVIDAKPSAVEGTLRDLHFEGAPYSYQYASEDVNLRRPAGVRPHPETGEPTAMELHPRLFETGDGRSLAVTHLEASRYEATGTHLDESMLSWDAGQGKLATILRNDTDLQFETIESERGADIDVA